MSEVIADALPSRKYHVALSFAGEDRDYVERVASQLRGEGVAVFYDKFEEATLWGKNLYTHLRDIYENKAVFTVIFISESYKKKVWTNHELESAQARAIESNQEYILPAFFDESVKVPGLLKTTGRISLLTRSPEDLARLIIQKIQDFGIELGSDFAYSDEAKADVDFPRPSGKVLSKILEDLKSHNWYTQSPAIEKIFGLAWEKLNKNEIFVLGRNIYQCACGMERKALSILNDLRKELAQLPADVAAHLLNGMFYEVYFDKEGEFRGGNLKGGCLDRLLKLQDVKKFEKSIAFIRKSLQPYRAHLPFLPSNPPEIVSFEVIVRKSDPPLIKSLSIEGNELLVKVDDDDDFSNFAWKLSLGKFTLKRLGDRLAEVWSIPPAQVRIKCAQRGTDNAEFRLPKGYGIRWPENGLA